MNKKYKKIKAELGLDLGDLFKKKKKKPLSLDSRNIYVPDEARLQSSQEMSIDTNLDNLSSDQLQLIMDSAPQENNPVIDDQTLEKERKKRNILGDIALGLGLAVDLLPDNNKPTIIQPEISYNPNMYGKGSQAIYADGGSIHIKEKNKGKFTAAAKRAGMSVQEYARKVLNDPDASPTLKKRANFARNASKWKHEDGGEIELGKGGKLSASKAKEMLKDGTAHGKKLTKKQKRYFGMVAAGKAELGDELPGNGELGGIDKLKYIYSSRQDQYQNYLKRAKQYQNTNDTIGLTQGKFNTAQVNKQIVDDAVRAARANGIDPYDLLGLIGQESTFGIGYQTKKGRRGRLENKNSISQQSLVSGWNLVEQPKDYALYLADRKAPGVGVERTSHGYSAGVTDESTLQGYLQKNSKLTDQYAIDLVKSADYSGTPDFFDLAAKHIKSKGFSGYNPGDPDYANKVAASKALLMKDPALNQYVSSLKFKKGGTVEGNADAGQMIEFKGPSHDNGGIDISYGGKQVEVEGGETAFVDHEGDLNILGNMHIPGTKIKFKTAGKVIKKEEEETQKVMDKGLELINNNSNPINNFDAIKLRTGKVMLEGGKMQTKNLQYKKEMLANIQNEMLRSMNNPFAANGTTITGEDDPKKSMAQRMNNPGNIKWGKWARKHGAVKGDPATDGGYFAKFPDVNTGLNALKSLLKTENYKDLSVDAAIKRWTNNAGYSVNYKDIAGKKINQLNSEEFQKLVNTITVGEDGKYYTPSGQTATPPPATPGKPVEVPSFTPYELPKQPKNQVTNTPPVEPYNYVPNVYDFVQRQQKNPAPLQSPLQLEQLSGELYSLATNQVEPVAMQKFTPELESPYQVSFQDKLNANRSTFNALQRATSSNPEALSVLAGQKYAADSQILGEEFRVNQQIFNDITNRNLTKLDDAELKNLGLADQQFVRQSTARSKTKAQTQLTLQSIGDKTLKNRYENLDSAFKQMLFNYRPADKDGDGVFETLEYQGSAPVFTNNTNPGSIDNEFISQRTKYDSTGKIKEIQTKEPSEMEKQQIKAKAQKAALDLTIGQYNSLFKKQRG